MNSENKTANQAENFGEGHSKRSSFSGNVGFVLAAAGSAVGLGNIWRFPYLAAQHGGGIFLLVYILLSVTFGFTLITAEIAIGRKTGLSPIGAFRALHRRFKFVGVLASLVPLFIVPYYSVIGGWVAKYAFGFMTGEMADMAKNGYFNSYISQLTQPIVWFLILICVCTLIVVFGVQRGIEKVSKIMMPLLIFIMLFVVSYTFVTTDGIWQGALYYIKPDLSSFTYMTVVSAMGQLFYSMSIGMGVMITFGSYMKKDISIEKSARQIEIFDTGIAFLGGLMIVPACIAYDPSQLTAGPGLMFGILPKIFNGMPGGAFIGALFFLMVLLAALTSLLSLTETIVSTVEDKWGLNRKISCLITLAASIVLGIFSCLGYSSWSGLRFFAKFTVLDFFDFITNSIMMPIIAILTCILIAYVTKPKTVIDEISLTGSFRHKTMFSVVIRYIAPVFLTFILIFALLEGVGIIAV